MELKKYLLYYPSQERDFLAKYPGIMEQYGESYMKWIQGLPMMEWVPLILRPGMEETTIGIICTLYRRGFVNITFHDSMTQIMRCPLNDDEFNEWAKGNGWHGKGIDRE